MLFRFTRLIPAAFVLFLPAAALAQNATADSSVSIIDQFAVTNDTGLSFGTIILPSSGANTIAIAASDGARSISGDGNAGVVGTGFSNATFTVQGDGGQGFDISVPANFGLSRSGGTETITVSLTQSALTGTTSGTNGSEGTASFGVGGNFSISTATIAGLYEGTFTVTVDNQ